MTLFEMMVKLGLDRKDFESGLDEAEKDGNGFMSKLSSGMGVLAKGVGVALGAATTGLVNLTKSAVENYASYEQLVGGVETLFKESAGVVQGYAATAFKEAGVSANAYMETVTSFSASLIQSLDGDTARAAEVSHTAILDMSDNANKMGTAMESIQTAYAGFAKQNFTMLDNLKLGYGGTKTEMERLLEDAEAIKAAHGEMADYSIDSFADIVEAIHVVQEDMGIYGTTAKEAATTIEGSMNSMKAAWDNLVTGLGDDTQDMNLLIQNFVDSAMTFLQDNLIPRINVILEGIGQMVGEFVPFLASQLPTMLDSLLPPLLEAATSVVTGVVSALPQIITILSEQIPYILQSVIDAIISTIPQFLESAGEIVNALAIGIKGALPTLIAAVPDIINTITDFISGNLNQFISVAIDIVSAIAKGIIDALPKIVAAIPQLVSTIIGTISSNLPRILATGIEILESIIAGILDNLPALVSACVSIVSSIVSFIVDNLSLIVESGIEIILALINGLVDALPELTGAIPQIISTILNGLMQIIPKIPEIGWNIVKGIWQGISSMGSWLWDKLTGWVGDVFGWIKGLFGIHSPSTKMRDQVGKMIGMGVAEGIEDSIGDIEKASNEMLGAIPSVSGDDFSVNVRRNMSDIYAANMDAVVDRIDKTMEGFSQTIVLTLNDREFGRAVRGYA